MTSATDRAAEGAAIEEGDSFEQGVAAVRAWFAASRFDGLVRLHTAREVAAQQGTIEADYTVAREAASAFYARLRTVGSEASA